MDRYAVIGNPIAHSKSPRIHAEFARQTGQEMLYEAIFAPTDGFAAAAGRFRDAGGRGMNVTAPFKLDAHDFADDLSVRARAAGASIRCPSGPRAKVSATTPMAPVWFRTLPSIWIRPCKGAESCCWVQAALRGV